MQSVLTGEAFRLLSSPCVYTCWNCGYCLYVGMSTQGLIRVLSPSHHMYRLLKEVSEQAGTRIDFDRVEINWCSTNEEAIKLERLLIKTLKPLMNRDNSTRINKTQFRTQYKATPFKKTLVKRVAKGLKVEASEFERALSQVQEKK